MTRRRAGRVRLPGGLLLRHHRVVNDTNHTIKGGGTITGAHHQQGHRPGRQRRRRPAGRRIFTNSGGAIKTVGSGIFDNAGPTTNIDSSFVMAGGTLRSTATRTYSSSLFSGYGTIERPLTINGGGSLTASGGTLSFASGHVPGQQRHHLPQWRQRRPGQPGRQPHDPERLLRGKRVHGRGDAKIHLRLYLL